MDLKDILFGLASLVLLLLFGFAVWWDEQPEWKVYQQTYYRMLAERTGNPKMKARPIRLQQIWNRDLDRADRCLTCHLGIANPKFADAPQPYRAHPHLAGYMQKHPFDRFGCTVCHEGDPRATAYERTHGFVKHLDRQLLAGPYVETACTKCHWHLLAKNVEAPETPHLMRGKQLVAELGCGACHAISQMGATSTLAPDLSDLGSKTELAFFLVHDFTYVKGPHTKQAWEWEHFKDPLKIMPGNPGLKVPPTSMPNFGLTDQEATDLTVLVMSLRNPRVEQIPMSYFPVIKDHDGYTQYTGSR